MWTLGGPRHWFKLQCVSLLLAYFTADSRLFFIIVYNQPRNFSVHSLNVFLFTRLPEWASVRFQMNYSLFHLQDQRQYRYCQSPNCSTHFSKLTSLFTLLLMWCSTFENSWRLHFSVYTSILSMAEWRLLYTITGRVNEFASASAI